MKYLILIVLVIALVTCIPAEVYARPRLPAKAAKAVAEQVERGAQRRQDRRAEGRGLARLAPQNWRLFGAGCN